MNHAKAAAGTGLILGSYVAVVLFFVLHLSVLTTAIGGLVGFVIVVVLFAMLS